MIEALAKTAWSTDRGHPIAGIIAALRQKIILQASSMRQFMNAGVLRRAVKPDGFEASFESSLPTTQVYQQAFPHHDLP
jgi:hypothetical protein